MNLVTGATGLVGMHVVRELLVRNRTVRAVFRSEERKERVQKLLEFYHPGQGDTMYAAIQWVQCDLEDVVEVEEALEGVETVYHCAAMVSFGNGHFSKMMAINRYGTANIVNLSIEKGVKAFCHVSSTAAIGKPMDAPEKLVTEKNKWEINEQTSGYAITKHSSEKEVWRGIEEGLSAVIVNPCLVLGPGDWNETSLTIFRSVKKGLRFYPPGANAVVDARDVAYRMVELIDRNIRNQRFLLIGENISFRELTGLIADRLGKKRPSIPVKPWMMGLTWRLATFFSFLTGKPTALTRQAATSAFSTTRYANDAIRQVIPEPFRSAKDAVENTVEFAEFTRAV